MLTIICFVFNCRWDSVIFECDYRAVVEGLTSSIEEMSWEATSILWDCKLLLHNFRLWEIAWVPRTANVAAHSLAKWSIAHNVLGVIRLESILRFICST